MSLSSRVLIFAELELMLLHQLKLMDGDAKTCTVGSVTTTGAIQ